MSTEPREPHRLPTLTEVVPIAPPPAAPAAPVVPAAAGGPAPPSPSVPLPPAHELVEQVLADVERQVGLMLEYRMREVLTTVIARATDTMVREARAELSTALREIVERAVAQELQRHRDRPGPR
jgi:hypothetical protein